MAKAKTPKQLEISIKSLKKKVTQLLDKLQNADRLYKNGDLAGSLGYLRQTLALNPDDHKLRTEIEEREREILQQNEEQGTLREARELLRKAGNQFAHNREKAIKYYENAFNLLTGFLGRLKDGKTKEETLGLLDKANKGKERALSDEAEPAPSPKKEVDINAKKAQPVQPETPKTIAPVTKPKEYVDVEVRFAEDVYNAFRNFPSSDNQVNANQEFDH